MKMMKGFSLMIFVLVFSMLSLGQQAKPISLQVDEARLKIANCRPGTLPTGHQVSEDSIIFVRAINFVSRKGNQIKYEVSAGKVRGSGRNVEWDLTGVDPGDYRISATHVADGRTVSTYNAKVVIEAVPCSGSCNCPVIAVNGPAEMVKDGELATFTASVSGGAATPTYNWTVANGEIVDGQGTPSITVRVRMQDTTKLVKATIELSGLNPDCHCPTTESYSFEIVDR